MIGEGFELVYLNPRICAYSWFGSGLLAADGET